MMQIISEIFLASTGFLKNASSAPVTNIAERTWLTLLMIAIIGLSFLGMRKGWQNRGKRELPPIETLAPSNLTELSPNVEARFAGTTISGKWLDRVTNYGLGTPRGVQVKVFTEGIYISDQAQFNLWIAADRILKIGTKRGIAGDVVEKNGMLIITWKHGDLTLDTGVRVSRHSDHELIVNAVKNFPDKLQNADTGADA